MSNKVDYPTKQSDDFFTVLGNTFSLAKQSWEAFKLNSGTFIVLLLAPLALVLLVLLPAFFMGLVASGRSSDTGFGSSGLLAYTIFAILFAIAVILFIRIAVATIIAELASVRGQTIRFQEAFKQAGDFTGKVIGLVLLLMLIIMLGFILLIVPGILAIFFTFFAVYFLIDKNCTITEAIRSSYDMTKQNWKIVLAFTVLQIVISLPGYIPVLGGIATFVLGVVYLCLPAILYMRMTAKTNK